MTALESICWGLVKAEAKGVKGKGLKAPPIPLVSVNVEACVVHAAAQVQVTQVYINKEEQPIEAIYYFPVNPEGAVTHFQAELEGRVIKGTVKPKEEAKEDYDNAVKNKTGAFLGEETSADIFKVCVGYLKPGTQVKVTIGYITEVKNEPGSNAIRFYIPTTVAPRYVPASESGAAAQEVKDMQFAQGSPAPLTLKVAVCLQGKIKSIESATHDVNVEGVGPIYEKKGWEKSVVTLSGVSTDMDRDFVLTILPEEPLRTRLYSEKLPNGSTAMMLHLLPGFKLKEQKTEILFVLDRSGSMAGKSMELAKKALLIFLHSMPADCYFNIVGFGSSFKFLFSKSAKYDDGSLKKAIAYAKGLEADLGGTEIFAPLKEIYQKSEIKGYLKQIFILTDGEVFSTEERILGIVRANAHKARVFALGIGDGASHSLVEGLAKAGGGTSAFVTYKESIDKKVLNQLKNGLQPSLTDIQLEWEGLTTAPLSLVERKKLTQAEKILLGLDEDEDIDAASAENLSKQSPKKIPPVYDGSQLLVFGLFKDEVPKGLTIKAQSPDGPLSVKIEHSMENDVGPTNVLHRLAAVKLVRELELEVAGLKYQRRSKDEEILKKEIIKLGCQNGITSKYTSFVAVDEKTDKPSDETLVMQTRQVPSQLANGWHGLSRKCGSSVRRSSILCGAGGSRKLKGNAKPKRKSSVASRSSAKRCKKASSAVRYGASAKRRTPRPAGKKSAKPVAKKTTSDDDSSSSSSEDEDMDMSPDNSENDEDVEMSDRDVGYVRDKLIGLQSYDGSYKLDEKLCALLKGEMKVLKEAAKKNNLQDSVIATALAIAFFTTKLAGEKDVWELVVDKARKWLSKTISPTEVPGVIQTATNLL